MSDPEPMPPQRVPTLTEVVVWPQSLRAAAAAGATDATDAADAAAARAEPAELAEPAEPLAVLPTEAQLVQRVLVDLQRQLDLMLEYRLREVLTPLLARATDNLIREARTELAATLRDVVARAVARELARHRVG